MNAADREALTRELTAARRTSGCVTDGALGCLDAFADAYWLQQRVREALGAKVAGWKLAAPPSGDVMSAPIYDIDCLRSDCVVDNVEVLRDGVECELAVCIDRTIPGGQCTRDDVTAAAGAVIPVFELLCSRLPSGFASPREHIVADGMGQGAVVLGAPCLDWRGLALDKLAVQLWSDDATVVARQGGNPFGDPLLAVAMLVEHLGRRGLALEAGTFVLTGSYTGVHRARRGERLRCVFEGVGPVGLTVSKA